MPRRTAFVLLFAASLLAANLCAAPARVNQSDPRLAKAFRKPDLNGWIFVHLEGTPSDIGFQHGYLLAPEIEDAHKVGVLGLTHDSHKPYAFFRTAAEKVLWPRVEQQYRDEVKGIAEGLKARGVALGGDRSAFRPLRKQAPATGRSIAPAVRAPSTATGQDPPPSPGVR